MPPKKYASFSCAFNLCHPEIWSSAKQNSGSRERDNIAPIRRQQRPVHAKKKSVAFCLKALLRAVSSKCSAECWFCSAACGLLLAGCWLIFAIGAPTSTPNNSPKSAPISASKSVPKNIPKTFTKVLSGSRPNRALHGVREVQNPCLRHSSLAPRQNLVLADWI